MGWDWGKGKGWAWKERYMDLGNRRGKQGTGLGKGRYGFGEYKRKEIGEKEGVRLGKGKRWISRKEGMNC